MGNSTSQWEDFVHSFPFARERASYSPPPTLSLRLISKNTWANYIEQYRKHTSLLLRSCGSIDFGSLGFGFGLPVFGLFMVCFVLVGCGGYFINVSLLVHFFLSFFGTISFYHFVMYVLVAVKKKHAQWKLQILIYCYANPVKCIWAYGVDCWAATPLVMIFLYFPISCVIICYSDSLNVSHPFSCFLTSLSRKSYTLNI